MKNGASSIYSKPVLSDHSKKTKKLDFKSDYYLMQFKSIAECSKGSILQYFRPSLTLSLPNFWGNVLLSAKYILGNVTTEGLAV